jgi:hypothetical protein
MNGTLGRSVLEDSGSRQYTSSTSNAIVTSHIVTSSKLEVSTSLLSVEYK